MNQSEYGSAGESQCDLILAELEAHRGHDVSLQRLCRVSGANRASARIHDLRKRGHRIENHCTNPLHGKVKSWYRLV
jgi:hypothetical protein